MTASELRARLLDLRATLRAYGAHVAPERLPTNLCRRSLRAMCAAEAERVRVLSSAEGAYYRQTHQGAA